MSPGVALVGSGDEEIRKYVYSNGTLSTGSNIYALTANTIVRFSPKGVRDTTFVASLSNFNGRDENPNHAFERHSPLGAFNASSGATEMLERFAPAAGTRALAVRVIGGSTGTVRGYVASYRLSQ